MLGGIGVMKGLTGSNDGVKESVKQTKAEMTYKPWFGVAVVDTARLPQTKLYNPACFLNKYVQKLRSTVNYFH